MTPIEQTPCSGSYERKQDPNLGTRKKDPNMGRIFPLSAHLAGMRADVKTSQFAGRNFCTVRRRIESTHLPGGQPPQGHTLSASSALTSSECPSASCPSRPPASSAADGTRPDCLCSAAPRRRAGARDVRVSKRNGRRGSRAATNSTHDTNCTAGRARRVANQIKSLRQNQTLKRVS